MKINKMKKVILTLSLGLGLSVGFTAPANALYGGTCEDYQFLCQNGSSAACNMWEKYWGSHC